MEYTALQTLSRGIKLQGLQWVATASGVRRVPALSEEPRGYLPEHGRQPNNGLNNNPFRAHLTFGRKIPLTLALSPGERGQRAAAADQANPTAGRDPFHRVPLLILHKIITH